MLLKLNDLSFSCPNVVLDYVIKLTMPQVAVNYRKKEGTLQKGEKKERKNGTFFSF